MAKENQVVVLKHVKRGSKHEFTIEHALRLLRLQETSPQKGWVLDDKKYKFEKNEIIRVTDTKNSTKPEK